MPGKKGRGKRGYRKRPTGARRRPALRRARLVVNRALQPIPQRYITKMKYSESVVTDALGMFTFNLNSIFDPNRTGTGHQPYSFDTMATLYNRYRVIACGWRIQPSYTNATAAQSTQIATLPANEVLTISSLSEVKENPRAKYVNQSLGGGIVTLSGKSYIPSLVGRNKSQYMADDRYQALVTASPNELAILNIYTSATGNDTPSAVSLNVLLEYSVEFFDVKNLAQS